MDYAKPELIEALAAEYAAGTLRHGARRRFEALMLAHPALRQAAVRWEDRMMPLTAPLAPVTPSDAVWAGIERRLGGSSPASAASSTARPSWWQRLGLWQGFAGAASVAALSLLVVVQQPAPEAPAQAPIVVVLGPSGAAGEPLATQARFVASVSADGRGLVLRPVDGVQLAADRALELWAVPAQGAPRSLGLVDGQRGATVLRAALLADTAAFAVSLEPSGGSPTGAPTGPVISVGKLQS